METAQTRIGIVDDDQKLVGLVKRYLSANGFSQVRSFSPAELISETVIPADLLILDIMMPEMDGFELLKRLRKIHDLPVIFLSAKSEVFDRVLGLELGADDFLTKPFEPRELLARIQAVLRRRSPSETGKGATVFGASDRVPSSPQVPLRFGVKVFQEFSFDMDRQIVLVGDRENRLTTFEFNLLRLFCDNPGIILSRQQIMDWMERNEFGSYDRSIDVGISRLRKKVERDHASPQVLKTVWGRGYQLLVQPRKTEA